MASPQLKKFVAKIGSLLIKLQMKSTKQRFLTLACGGSLLLILLQQISILAAPSTKPTLASRLQPTEIDEWKIKDIAKQITVRVSSQENTASGILINRKDFKVSEQPNYVYIVVTNYHVVQDKKAEYQIETPDGRIYKAFLHPDSDRIFINQKIDLALLYFLSPIPYKTAKLGNSDNIKNENGVFVGGFACQGRLCEKETEFIFQPGTALLLNKPLSGGYQLGFTSATKPGTSGCVVLNKKGELVAINGRGKFALKNSQYVYIDEESPSEEVQKFMRHFAWGIPINKYKELASQVSIEKINLPPNSTEYSSTIHLTSETSDQTIPSSTDYNWTLILTIICGTMLVVIVVTLLPLYRKKNHPDDFEDFLKEFDELVVQVNLFRKDNTNSVGDLQQKLSGLKTKINNLQDKNAKNVNNLSEQLSKLEDKVDKIKITSTS